VSHASARLYLVPQGPAPTALWVRNSSLAADHAAAGSFETAMQRLNEQVGATNFAPLKPHLLALYQASRVAVAATPSVPGLLFPVHRNWSDAKPNAVLPSTATTLARLVEQLQAAYRLVTAGKFADAIAAFRALLYAALLCVVSTKSDSSEVRPPLPRDKNKPGCQCALTYLCTHAHTQIAQMVGICREYLLGLTLEVARKATAKEDAASLARAAELAAYFTHCNLQPVHLTLALRAAMTLCFKLNNFVSAAALARRLLELGPKPEIAAQVWGRFPERLIATGSVLTQPARMCASLQARKVQEVADRTPRDEVKLNYDEHNPFVICGATLTPVRPLHRHTHRGPGRGRGDALLRRVWRCGSMLMRRARRSRSTADTSRSRARCAGRTSSRHTRASSALSATSRPLAPRPVACAIRSTAARPYHALCTVAAYNPYTWSHPGPAAHGPGDPAIKSWPRHRARRRPSCGGATCACRCGRRRWRLRWPSCSGTYRTSMVLGGGASALPAPPP
jgi:hypothetical protein